MQLLAKILTEMGKGNKMLTVIPIDAELTTQQAADLLKVSLALPDRVIGGGENSFSGSSVSTAAYGSRI